jgi:hypothetical protein
MIGRERKRAERWSLVNLKGWEGGAERGREGMRVGERAGSRKG